MESYKKTLLGSGEEQKTGLVGTLSHSHNMLPHYRPRDPKPSDREWTSQTVSQSKPLRGCLSGIFITATEKSDSGGNCPLGNTYTLPFGTAKFFYRKEKPQFLLSPRTHPILVGCHNKWTKGRLISLLRQPGLLNSWRTSRGSCVSASTCWGWPRWKTWWACVGTSEETGQSEAGPPSGMRLGTISTLEWLTHKVHMSNWKT